MAEVAAEEMPLLSIENICKTYPCAGGDLQVLQGVSLDVARGEFLSVIGASGSGKSTLLQIVGTLDRPDDGARACFEGRSLFDMGDAQQARLRNASIGFVYQAHHLIPELSAIENVMLPLFVRGDDASSARERAGDLLERLGLGERLEHVPARLSGGEAQRVAVARALACKPRLLLADEPTGNLDEKTAGQVFDALRQLCREEHAAVMMVTHSRELAAASDRVYQLTNGKLAQVEY